MNIIEIHSLKKYYGKNRGVEEVSFSIGEGEIFGFIGPNGAGKSTTIRCALGLIFPTSGSISIFGRDAIKERAEIAQEIGYLPSEVNYYRDMRVKDLLAYSASFYKRDSKLRAKELCELLELDQKKKITDLSLGNKKKVGIVQALQHQPKFILLDEPTSGLDPLIQHRFFNLLEEERRQGASVLFSSHVLGDVKRLCDRVAIIREGVVEEIQPVETMEDKNNKRVTLAADESVLLELDALETLLIKYQEPGLREYFYLGEIQELLQLLASVNIHNLTIEDPPLEEIFMHYYESRLK